MARIPVCNCPNCNNVGTHKIQVYRRGAEGHAYLCDMHYRRDESYYFENSTRQGTMKKHKGTISVEFEVSRATEKARIEFTASGYVPTHDGTVAHEFKSPIMYGLNGISKHCVTFDRLIADGNLEVNHTCGTHFNVGNVEAINAESIDYIARFVHSLFVPLSDYLNVHPAECAAVFGRPLNGWARPITANSNAREHTNFINLQHDTHIEYRVCKFVNGKQYMNAAKLCVAFTDCIIANFVEHFNDTDFDRRRYPNITAYRRHKAAVTANKLVKLFQKAAANA